MKQRGKNKNKNKNKNKIKIIFAIICFYQTFFFVDQLIADNPKSSKQTFRLSQITITSIATRWGGSQIISIFYY